MKKMFYLILPILMVSCSKPAKISDNLTKEVLLNERNIQLIDTPTTTGDQAQIYTNEGAKKVIEDFYNWYIFKAYNGSNNELQLPPYKKISDSVYIFDSKKYLSKLRSVGFFSEAFINKERNKLDECNQVMLTEVWEYEPEPEFNIEECNYLWTDRWVGGQGEKINGFKILSLTKQNEEVQGLVEIQIDNKRFVEAKVTLTEDESGSYKIDSIQLIWG